MALACPRPFSAQEAIMRQHHKILPRTHHLLGIVWLFYYSVPPGVHGASAPPGPVAACQDIRLGSDDVYNAQGKVPLNAQIMFQYGWPDLSMFLDFQIRPGNEHGSPWKETGAGACFLQTRRYGSKGSAGRATSMRAASSVCWLPRGTTRSS